MDLYLRIVRNEFGDLIIVIGEIGKTETPMLMLDELRFQQLIRTYEKQKANLKDEQITT